jgi:hypothetical protein
MALTADTTLASKPSGGKRMLRRLGSPGAVAVVVIVFRLAAPSAAAPVPSDFALHAEAGGRIPYLSVRRVDVVGTTATTAVVPPEGRATGTATETGTVALAPAALQCLYDTVTAAGALAAASPLDPGLSDGTYAMLRVTADGTTSTLVAQNQAFAPIDDVIRRLNSLVPESAQLRYNAIGSAVAVPCP